MEQEKFDRVPVYRYALGDAIILALALGTKVVLSPTFGPDKIANYLGKFTICFYCPYLLSLFERPLW